MLTKLIKILLIGLALNLSMGASAVAGEMSTSIKRLSNTEMVMNFIDFSQEIDTFSAKLGEPYNEANDPAMHKSAPPEEPQHGYFIVSALMLVGVGVFLYFLKMD